ncbi:hypothetical protein PGB90_004775 [Kerria lacca]
MIKRSFLYQLIFKRTGTMVLTAVLGGIILETAIDNISEAIFFKYNKGKLWDDIKHNYVKDV